MLQTTKSPGDNFSGGTKGCDFDGIAQHLQAETHTSLTENTKSRTALPHPAASLHFPQKRVYFEV